MDRTDPVSGLVDRVQGHASVDQVYGDPIERSGKQVVPVAEVAYGFGGGAGPNGPAGPDADDADRTPDESEGYGLGGGVWARPAGVVEITDDGTRFVPQPSRRRTVALAVLCFALGYLLGRES